MSVLPRVLDHRSMPEAELTAAGLDGDLVRVAEGWCARGQPICASERLGGVLAGMPAHWIAERATAAWVWGAGPRPATLEVAVLPPRNRGVRPPGVTIRHVCHLAGDTVRLDGRSVTTPFRTALDLAHQPERAESAALIAELCSRHGLLLPELAERAMSSRRALAEREAAVHCLLEVQPLLTR